MRTRLRALLLFLPVLLLQQHVVAQDSKTFFPKTDDERTFYGGFVLGANFTQVDGDNFSGYHKVGLNAGPIVYARFSNLFGASMELLFSQKGSKVRTTYESPYTGTSVEGYDMKLNYVEVPVLLHIIPPGKFHYSAGASYGYLISSKEEAFTVAPVNLDPQLYPFRKTDINLIVGGSYHIYRHLFVNGRYAYSLTTIRDPNKVPEAYGGGRNQYNNLFTIKFMWLF